MARQRGVIKIDGTIDDLTFYKTSDGYLVRSRGGVSAERIATDPAFARTRENGMEFSRAGKASKLLRTVFRTQLQNARGKRTPSRLTQELMRVIHTDAGNPRGMRTVQGGELSLLLDFDFNDRSQLGSVLFADYTATINRATGAATVSLPDIVPVNDIVAPAGATHFILHVAAAEVDFESEVYKVVSEATELQEFDASTITAQDLTCSLPAASTLDLVLIMGIEFFQKVSNEYYSLKNGGYNALTVVAVDEAA